MPGGPAGFHTLTPDTVIDIAEQSLGVRFSGLCRPLNSYINRVYELQTADGDGVVAKFYRPGRWNREGLQDEHDFLLELEAQEIPVISPITIRETGTLGERDGMYYTFFPKKSGRNLDEPDYDQWEQLGRLLARVHNVGAVHPPRNRITMAPNRSTLESLEYILKSGVIEPELARQYEEAVHGILEMITPLWEGVELHRIHGDCHRANIIQRGSEQLWLIDFDDMAVGPAVQDFWMLLPDYSKASLAEIDMFLEGYATFRPFNRQNLYMIEPLRAMRYIYFTAWCAMQSADGGFARLIPGWGTTEYWRECIRDLRDQQDEIVATRDTFFGM